MKKLYSIKTLDELAEHFERHQAEATAAANRAKTDSRAYRSARERAEAWRQAAYIVRATVADPLHGVAADALRMVEGDLKSSDTVSITTRSFMFGVLAGKVGPMMPTEDADEERIATIKG